MTKAIEKWSGRWYRRKLEATTLVLFGPSGTGKTLSTMRAYEWAKRASFSSFDQGFWASPFQPIFIRWASWWHQVERSRDTSDAIEDITRIPVLFIDDIGAEADRFKSKESTALLADILALRERKFTLITTNIHKDQWGEHWDTRVDERLSRNHAVHVDLNKLKPYHH